MDREAWRSYPAENLDDALFLALLAVTAPADRFVAARSDGAARSLRIRHDLVVEQPLGESAAVASRLAFPDGGPAGDETLEENPWELAARFLERAESDARRLAAAAQELTGDAPGAGQAPGVERTIELEHGGRVRRFAIRSTETGG